MAGTYVHIPFCRKKCSYCNFFSLASRKFCGAFLEALYAEIRFNRDYLGGAPVETLYFGGGTPSLFSPSELQGIVDEIAQTFPLAKDAEITLELNPDDVTEEYVRGLQQTSFRRFSLGVQSFFADDLQWLTRIHNGQQAIGAVRLLQEAGLSNITIDLIYGIPTLTEEKWQQNLDTTFALGIPHISAYALTVEPKTILDVKIRRKELSAPREEEIAAQYKILTKRAAEEGYLHYEISNFCLPGFHSRHNSNYWKGVPYLGFGPSAHSFNGTSRRWSPPHLENYIRYFTQSPSHSVTQSPSQQVTRSPFYTEEVLTPSDRYNEYVMTGLRTMWGCDISIIEKEFGTGLRDHFIKQAQRHLDSGKMVREGTISRLTEEGMLFADGIAADCFIS